MVCDNGFSITQVELTHALVRQKIWLERVISRRSGSIVMNGGECMLRFTIRCVPYIFPLGSVFSSVPLYSLVPSVFVFPFLESLLPIRPFLQRRIQAPLHRASRCFLVPQNQSPPLAHPSEIEFSLRSYRRSASFGRRRRRYHRGRAKRE